LRGVVPKKDEYEDGYEYQYHSIEGLPLSLLDEEGGVMLVEFDLFMIQSVHFGLT
jgi:hypothetical protein